MGLKWLAFPSWSHWSGVWPYTFRHLVCWAYWEWTSLRSRAMLAILLETDIQISISICLCLCQLINFQWEIQLSSRLDCLIWQISSLSPCRQASWETKLLIWMSIDDWEIQLSSWPSISDEHALSLLARYMGTMLPQTTWWAWQENLEGYLFEEVSLSWVSLRLSYQL